MRGEEIATQIFQREAEEEEEEGEEEEEEEEGEEEDADHQVFAKHIRYSSTLLYSILDPPVSSTFANNVSLDSL